MASFREVLADRTVREVHAQPRRKWLPITTEHGVYQIDLMFLDQYAHQNRGYNGILTIVEVPNRYAYAFPVKDKGNDTYRAFELFLKEAKADGHDVVRCEFDGGSEFTNRKMKQLLKDHNIEQTIVAPGDSRKKGIVERFNGTLRGWIERWLTGKQTNNWVDVMPQILEHYNERKHRTTGMAPKDMTVKDEDRVRDRLNLKATVAVAGVNSIAPGDRVRILMHKKAFGKGKLRWSDNVHTIEGRVDGTNSFTLVGQDGEYKYSDLQRVGAGSVDVKAKSPETVALAKKREHALRLSREQLTRRPGVRAAEELIEEQEDHSEEPVLSGLEEPAPLVRRSTRERKAPVEWWKAGGP